MKIQAVVASTYKDYENGWSYSDSALVDLAKSAKNKPIIYMKHKIGHVISGKFDDGKVIVTALISKSDEILNKILFLVPRRINGF